MSLPECKGTSRCLEKAIASLATIVMPSCNRLGSVVVRIRVMVIVIAIEIMVGIVGSIVLAFHTQITTSKEKHVLV